MSSLPVPSDLPCHAVVCVCATHSAQLIEDWEGFTARPDAATYKALQVSSRALYHSPPLSFPHLISAFILSPQIHTALDLRSVTLQPPALTLNSDKRLAVFAERGGCWSVGDDVVLFDTLTGSTKVNIPSCFSLTSLLSCVLCLVGSSEGQPQ